MRPADNIHKLVKNTKIKTNPEVNKAVLDDLLDRMDRAEGVHTNAPRQNIWRIIMKNKVTKIAAAAVILIAIMLSITTFDNTVNVAYAIEQSIKASHTVETLHIRLYKSAEAVANGLFDEVYMKYDPSGKLESARLDVAQSADGPKTIVWSKDVAKVWLKAKKSVVILREKKMAREMEKMAVELDPKRTLQNLYEMQQKGEQDVKITEPEEDGDFIAIEVIHDKGRDVFYVDPESKLLLRFEKQVLNGQDYVLAAVFEFYGYNEPIDENVFTLGDLPKDVFVLDQVNQEVGLLQGDLTDDEVVIQVATRFFQALIDEDYAKAGLLMEGLPADRIKRAFYGLKFVRIVSIGKVIPHSNPRTKGLTVPCEIEYTVNGQTMTKTYNPGIRKVQGRPDRWTIFGGI